MEWKQMRSNIWYLFNGSRIRGTMHPHRDGFEWKFYYSEDEETKNQSGVEPTVDEAKSRIVECCTEIAGDGQELLAHISG